MHITQSVTIAGAAEVAGVTDRAIRAAIDRGELIPQWTSCRRAKVLSLRAVEKWAATERKRGPKPKR